MGDLLPARSKVDLLHATTAMKQSRKIVVGGKHAMTPEMVYPNAQNPAHQHGGDARTGRRGGCVW
jgi:hypothetical protein